LQVRWLVSLLTRGDEEGFGIGAVTRSFLFLSKLLE
jgi:hypothetical protein